VELVLEELNLGFRWEEAIFVSEAHLVHLVSFPALDLLAHHGFAHRADRASVIAAAPEGRQAQRDEFGSQDVRGRALQAIGHFCHAPCWVCFYKQVYAIRRDRQAVRPKSPALWSFAEAEP